MASPPPPAANTAELHTTIPVLKTFAEHRPQVLQIAQEIYERDNPDKSSSSVRPTFTFGETLSGSYHILVPVVADNTAPYLFKLPLNGTRTQWNGSAARALASEAQTMTVLSRTMCVPRVYAYAATVDNPIGCPYIVLAHMAGVSLYDVWFGHHLHPDTISRQTTRQCRMRALDGIAREMVKLGAFAFDKAGAPVFDDKGKIVDIGVTRFLDHRAMEEKFRHKMIACKDEQDEEEKSVKVEEDKVEVEVGKKDVEVEEDRVEEDKVDDDDEVIYADWPPNADPKAYYTRSLDMFPEKHKYSMGVEKFQRMLIGWIPEPEPEPEPAPEPDVGGDAGLRPFVLAHPDFDLQNFLVNTDGTLVGIIDWDGVEAVPRSIGNLALPGFLTRDWDPLYYAFEPAMADEEQLAGGYQPEGSWEDSEACLADYRSIYAGLIATHTRPHACAERAAQLTRRSLLADNLAVAAFSPVPQSLILDKVVSEMWDAYRDDDSGIAMLDDERAGEAHLYPSFHGIAERYLQGDLEPSLVDRLHDAFQALLDSLERP